MQDEFEAHDRAAGFYLRVQHVEGLSQFGLGSRQLPCGDQCQTAARTGSGKLHVTARGPKHFHCVQGDLRAEGVREGIDP